MKDRSLEIIFKIAQKKLAKFGVKEVGLNPMQSKDGVPALIAQVESIKEDIPNSLEINGVIYDVIQSGGTRVEFCAGEELDIPTDKPVGERLQNWDTGDKSTAGRPLRAMVFETDCNALIDPAPNQTKTRPIKCGTAISVGGSTYGTLGCLAVDDTDGTLVGVTNAHVVTDKFLIHSKAEGLGFGGALVDKVVRQGDLSTITAWGTEEEIGMVKRFFPVGLEYESSPIFKNVVKNDEAELDVALISLKESVVDANSWKLAGIANDVGTVPFDDSPYTFANEREFEFWLRDSYWAGYTKDVGGGVDSFNTAEEPEMITSSATTGPNPGVTDPKWRIWGPVIPKGFPFENQREDSGTIEIEVKGLVAMARQQNEDRYKDVQGNIKRGEYYCSHNIIPGDSGSVLFAYFDEKESFEIEGYSSSITAGWKAVGIFFATEFDANNTPTRAFLMPMWKIARQMQISPWDGNLGTTNFSDNAGVFDTELKYVRGKSSVYQYKDGDKSYFQVGGVPGPDNIADREYINAAESFPNSAISEDLAGRFENVAPLEDWINFSSITVDIPDEGSYDKSDDLANANALWFKLNNLKVNSIEVPGEILNPLNGACFIDVAVIDEDSYENLEDVYFLDENLRKTKVYASAPIIESYGQGVDNFVVNYAKKNLGAGVKGSSKNLISSNLSRARYANGGQSAFAKFEGKNLNISEDTYYAGYRPWKTAADGLKKGEAKASPEDIESWISSGAKIVIVAYFVGNSSGVGGASKTLIKKLDVSAITNTSSKVINDSKDTGLFPPLPATEAPTTETINYTVTGVGGKYFIQGGVYTSVTQTPQLTFEEGNTYVFDWSAAPTHPFKFSETVNGTRNGGTEFLYNVTKDSSAKTISITIDHNTPSDGANVSLYYYCPNHSNMGNGIVVNIEEANKPEMMLTVNPSSGLAASAGNQSTFTDEMKKTILVPIFKTGPAGAKIEWGDGSATDIPANWDGIVDDSLTVNGVDDAWGYTVNGNMPANIASTNLAKLCHKYSTLGSVTMKITGDVLFFGDPFVVNGNNGHTARMKSQFSSRINSILDFPYWPNCDFSQSFRYSNINNWNVDSIFKGFKKLDYFIGQALGSSAINSSTCNGMIDNWDFSNYSPSGNNTIFESNLLVDDNIVVGRTASANPANINNANTYEVLKDICSNNSKKLIIGHNIDFSLYSTGNMSWFAAGSSIDFNLSKTNKLNFNGGIIPNYTMLNFLVQSGYAEVGALVIGGEDFFKNTTVSQSIMNSAFKNFTFGPKASYERMFQGATLSSDLNLSTINFSGANCNAMFSSLNGENFELTFPEIDDPASIVSFLSGAKVKKINGLDEMTISPSTDTGGAFSDLKTAEDFEIGKWNLSDRQIYNYIHEMIYQTYDEGSPDPTKVFPSRSFEKWKDFPQDLRVETGSYSYITNEGNCGIRFYAKNPGPTAGEQTISIVDQQGSDNIIVNGLQSITINLTGSATARTITEVITLVESDSVANSLIDCQAIGGLTNTAAFSPARLDTSSAGEAASVGQLILPENLKFLQEIIGWYEFIIGGSAGTDSFSARKTVTGYQGILRPSFPTAGKYAIFVDSNKLSHPTYTASDSSTRKVPHELEMYQSKDGIYSTALVVANQETFTTKYSYGEGVNAGDNHLLSGKSTGTWNAGENSYWMIIDIDPRRFSLENPHWKYKSKLDKPSGGGTVSVAGFSNNANNYFNNDNNHIINVTTSDSDGDGILDIDEIGDEILDATSGDSKITITYADSSEYSDIATSKHNDFGMYDEIHEIATNKVGVCIRGIGTRGITIDWGDGSGPQAYSNSDEGIIIKDYGSSLGEKTIIIEGDITSFAAKDSQGSSHQYGVYWRASQEDLDVRTFLGSQFRMKSFKYEGGGSLLILGQIFQVGSWYPENAEQGKTAYDPTNYSVLDGTTPAGLPKTNYQVDVDFSKFKPRRLRNLSSIFMGLYTHDLNLGNLDFSKIKQFDNLFAGVIVTGTLTLPRIDDSSLEMTEARHFTGDSSKNYFFGSTLHSTTNQPLKLAALKKAYIDGKQKRLDWGSGDNSAFKQWDDVVLNNSNSTRQSWFEIARQYREFDNFFNGAVINKISYGSFKPIFTDQRGHLEVLGLNASYIDELDLNGAARFPIGETNSEYSDVSNPKTKKPSDNSDCEITVDFLSRGEVQEAEGQHSGPYGRTINIKIFKGKMHTTGVAQSFDIRYDSLTLPRQVGIGEVTFQTAYTSGDQNVELKAEASDSWKSSNGNQTIQINLKHNSSLTGAFQRTNEGTNSSYGSFYFELTFGNHHTLQNVIDAVAAQSEIKTCTKVGGTGSLTDTLTYLNENWYISCDMNVDVICNNNLAGGAGATDISTSIVNQYTKLTCYIGTNITKQQLIDAINAGTAAHGFVAQYPPYYNQSNKNDLVNYGSEGNVSLNSGLGGKDQYRWTGGGVDPATFSYYINNTSPWKFNDFVGTAADQTPYEYAYEQGVEVSRVINMFPGNTYVFDWSEVDDKLLFSTTEFGTHNAGSTYSEHPITVDVTAKTTTVVCDKFLHLPDIGLKNQNAERYSQSNPTLFGYFESKGDASIRTVHLDLYDWCFKGENSWEKFGLTSRPTSSNSNFNESTYSQSDADFYDLTLHAGVKYVFDYSALTAKTGSPVTKFEVIGDQSGSDWNTRKETYPYLNTVKSSAKKLELDLRTLEVANYNNPFDYGSATYTPFANSFEFNTIGLAFGDSTKNDFYNGTDYYRRLRFSVLLPPATDGKYSNIQDDWWVGSMDQSNGLRFSKVVNEDTLTAWRKAENTILNNKFMADQKFAGYQSSLSALFGGYNDVYSADSSRGHKVDNTWGGNLGSDSMTNSEERTYNTKQAGAIGDILKLKLYKYTGLTKMSDWNSQYVGKTI